MTDRMKEHDNKDAQESGRPVQLDREQQQGGKGGQHDKGGQQGGQHDKPGQQQQGQPDKRDDKRDMEHSQKPGQPGQHQNR
jgi:hypothetical protein